METRDRTDALYGIEAIAEHLGITRGQAKHRIAQGLIPTFKMGRIVCARRSSINTALAEREAKAQICTM